jgi:multidrug efflux pump subunit AcrA (membrane-fusion protein)
MRVSRLLCTAVAIGSTAFAGGCGRTSSAAATKEAAPHAIVVAKVESHELRRAIDVVGTLAADEEVTVSSEVEGRVLRIAADLGDRVRAGQALVVLDPEKLQYRLDQQRATLGRAMARYGVADPAAPLPAIERTPDVQRAAAELELAGQAFRRASELHRQKLLPQQQMDDADAMLKSKKAADESALQGSRNLRADIDSERANLKLAEASFRDGTIRAPFDAYVQKRLVSPGEFVKTQTAVMSLVKIDPLKLTAEVPEKMAAWVKVGQSLTLAVEAMPNAAVAGHIARLSPAVNPQTRSFPIEGRVPNPDGRLKPGGFARVHITTDLVEHVLTVPAAALQYRYGVNRVFVVKGNRLRATEITIGDRVGERVEVVGGVAAGEPIAAKDVETLADGALVASQPARK